MCQGGKPEVEIYDCSWKQKERIEIVKREGDMLESVLWSVQDIEARVAEIGQAISKDFDGRPVVILGVTTLPSFSIFQIVLSCRNRKFHVSMKR